MAWIEFDRQTEWLSAWVRPKPWSSWHLCFRGRTVCGRSIDRVAQTWQLDHWPQGKDYPCRICFKWEGPRYYWTVRNRDGRCLACGATTRLQVDHIVPLFRGGTWDYDNLQTLCKRCNCRKGTKTIDYRPASTSERDVTPAPLWCARCDRDVTSLFPGRRVCAECHWAGEELREHWRRRRSTRDRMSVTRARKGYRGSRQR